jgi:hypothetical protein
MLPLATQTIDLAVRYGHIRKHKHFTWYFSQLKSLVSKEQIFL